MFDLSYQMDNASTANYIIVYRSLMYDTIFLIGTWLKLEVKNTRIAGCCCYPAIDFRLNFSFSY